MGVIILSLFIGFSIVFNVFNYIELTTDMNWGHYKRGKERLLIDLIPFVYIISKWFELAEKYEEK